MRAPTDGGARNKERVHADTYGNLIVLLSRFGRADAYRIPDPDAAWVREAAAFMGTPSNHGLLEQIGLATVESKEARPNDLILTVDADSDAAAEEALAAAKELLAQRRQVSESAAEMRPRTLESALRMLPDANLVAISVPGAYAKFEAMKAIKHGLHVFLFSDNVPVQDEIELKTEAVRRGVLCMGPDCGTAYLNGIGVGFTNVAPRGRIGFVAAAGTGLRRSCRVLPRWERESRTASASAVGMSAEVGGMMTFFAFEALADDPSTEAIVIISKPPHPTVLPRLEAAMAKIRKPIVACVLGAACFPAEQSRVGRNPRPGRRRDRRAPRQTGLEAADIRGYPGDPDALETPPRGRADRARGGRPVHRWHAGPRDTSLARVTPGARGAESDPRPGRRSVHRGPASTP